MISAAALWSSLADPEKRGCARACAFSLCLSRTQTYTQILRDLFFLVIVMIFPSQTGSSLFIVLSGCLLSPCLWPKSLGVAVFSSFGNECQSCLGIPEGTQRHLEPETLAGQTSSQLLWELADITQAADRRSETGWTPWESMLLTPAVSWVTCVECDVCDCPYHCCC